MNRQIWPKVIHCIADSIKQHQNGGLMILSSGISVANLTSLFLTYFLEKSRSVIILLNYSNHEIDFIDTQLNFYAAENKLNNNKELALQITVLTKLPADKRAIYYKQGGIFALTNQIFMQDLLINTLSPFLITHLIIQQAHSIKTKYDYESWITNYIKIQKPELFVLALSNQAPILQLQQNTLPILRYLYLDRILPWPINRAEIVINLKTTQLSWSEIKFNIPKVVKEIQECIISLINQCVSSVNGKCGATYLTSDMILQQSQQKLKAIIQRQQFKVDLAQQQTFMDIFQLRKLLFSLVNQTSFQFYCTLTRTVNEAPIDSIWYIAHPDIETLVDKITKLSQERAFQFVNSEPTQYQFKKKDGSEVQRMLSTRIQFNIEAQAKLHQMCRILHEIQNQNQTQSNENHRVWIWVKNIENVKYIQQHLIATFKMKDKTNIINQFNYLRLILPTKAKQNLDQLLESKADQQKQENQQQPFKKKTIVLKHNNKIIKQAKQVKQDEEQLLLALLNDELQLFFSEILEQKQMQLLEQVQSIKQNSKKQDFQLLPKELQQADQYYGKVNDDGLVVMFEEDNIIPNMTIVVNSIQDECQRQIFRQTYKPNHILIMEPYHSFLKELLICENEAQTYLLLQNDCVESWQYYKEKLDEEVAFEKIIEENKNCARSYEKPEDSIISQQQTLTSTRQGRGEQFFAQSDSQPRILVDYREFRSDVPPKLYFNGFILTPVMLKVGDIILSNNCAIERKSVETGDLIESLNQNRLDSQLQRMSQFDYPFLLIEYSDNIPFCLGSLVRQSVNYNNNTRIMGRLLDLMIKYPKIQIIWSNNSNDTIKIIGRLKSTLGKNTPELALFKSNAQQQNVLQSEKITNYFSQIEKVID